MSELPQPVIPALVASGFPFQTAVAAAIPQAEGWTVTTEEFPWQDAGGTDRLLDIVASNGALLTAIECKKTQKEHLIFLRPEGSSGKAQRARCLFLTQIQDSSRRMEVFCADWFFVPESVEAAFCIVSTSEKGRDQRLLERDAHLLIRGTDAYARFHKRTFQRRSEAEPNRPYLPVLVTNANLFVARYKPDAVSLETGQFDLPPKADVFAIKWVRFAKAFTSYRMRDVGIRTVFVVQATALVGFLESLAVQGEGPSQRGRTCLSD